MRIVAVADTHMFVEDLGERGASVFDVTPAGVTLVVVPPREE